MRTSTISGAFIILMASVFFVVLAHVVYGAENFRWNNENWHTTPHPQVVSFSVLENGDAYGFVEGAIYFRQYTIPNTLGVRIQRFEMEDHYHYIVDGTIIYTTEELSAELARHSEHMQPREAA